jgi:Tfp pilus assembly protein PilN
MRPVNLIPPEERRGERAPARTGGAPYVVLGVLALAVAAVAAMALTSKQISDREAEVVTLEAREAEAAARAEALAPYAQFATLSEARRATVSTLATSRFDWERVLRELALVMPDDIWLTELSGAATGGADGSGSGLAAEVTGPSLTMTGCGEGHESVAAFLQTLRDIDGVTRVGVLKSEKPTGAENESTGAGGGDADCRTRDFISQFEIVVAFDEVAVAAPADSAVPAPAAPAASAETASTGAGTDVVAGVTP